MKVKFLLFILKILRIVITIFTLSLTAKFFGVSVERDNWIVAYTVFIVIDLAIWGPINETFRAKFVEKETLLGTDESLKSANSLFKFINFITVGLVILLFFSSSFLAKYLLPNASGKDVAQLILMIKLISPSLIINQANLLMTSILNAFNVFYIPEITGVVTAILNILIMILLEPYFGIYSLVYSHYSSLIVLFLLLLFQFHSKKIKLFHSGYKYKFSEVKPYLLFALPFFFPYFIGQLGSISEKYIANLIGVGTVSNVDYSRRFLDIPINVLSSLMTTLYVPIVTKMYFNGDYKNIKIEFKNFLKFGFIIIIFFSSFMVFYSEEIVDFLFNKGNITKDNLEIINNILQLYVVSAVGVFLYVIAGLTMISTDRAKIYAIYGVTAQVLIIICNFAFYKIIGVYIFPLASFLIHIIAALIMVSKINKYLVAFKDIFKTLSILALTLLSLETIKTFFFTNNNLNVVDFSLKLSVYSFILILIMLFFYKKESRTIFSKMKNLIST